MSHEVDFCRVYNAAALEKLEKLFLENRVSYFIKATNRTLVQRLISRSSARYLVRINEGDVERATAIAEGMKDVEILAAPPKSDWSPKVKIQRIERERAAEEEKRRQQEKEARAKAEAEQKAQEEAEYKARMEREREEARLAEQARRQQEEERRARELAEAERLETAARKREAARAKTQEKASEPTGNTLENVHPEEPEQAESEVSDAEKDNG